MGQPRQLARRGSTDKWKRFSQAAHNFLKPSCGELTSDRIDCLQSDIKEIVNKRSGSVLTRLTILKADRCTCQCTNNMIHV
jgi:hypothetical protein